MATIKDAQSLLTTVPILVGSILRLRGTFTTPIGTPNGIAELQQVELNGYPQWVLIRGHDVTDPLSSSSTEVRANRTYGSPTTRRRSSSGTSSALTGTNVGQASRYFRVPTLRL